MPRENLRLSENTWHTGIIPARRVLLNQVVEVDRPRDLIGDAEMQFASTKREVAEVEDIGANFLRQVSEKRGRTVRTWFACIPSNQVVVQRSQGLRETRLGWDLREMSDVPCLFLSDARACRMSVVLQRAEKMPSR